MIMWRVFSLLLIWFGASSGARAADVEVYTEYYPPYSMEDENGQIVGHATELVRQVMNESGLEYEIKLVPWNRAYTLSMQLENVLVYSLLHTEERAGKYHWIAPVLTSDLFLYGRAEEAAAFSPDRLISGALMGACVIGDIACAFLRDMGMPDDKIIQLPDTYRSEAKVVELGRADVFIAQERYMPLSPEGPDAEAQPFVKLMKLDRKMTFCLAAGVQVRPAIISAVQQAYARLKARGTYMPLQLRQK